MFAKRQSALAATAGTAPRAKDGPSLKPVVDALKKPPVAAGLAGLLLLSTSALFGIALVSGGIISLAFRQRRLAVPSLPYALGTGFFIAAYSVTDGIGARLSGAPMAYTAWMCALWGVLMPLVYIGLRGARSLLAPRPGLITALMGGLVSLLAYGIVIYAMSESPMGSVSALRETSVLFAALISRLGLSD